MSKTRNRLSKTQGDSGEYGKNFIREIIDRDLAEGCHETVITRFPPEPNGYLHIGHAKSIVLNFGLAEEYGGRCHLRFDDTNPEKENEEYIRSIKETVAWLGYDWGGHLYFASDYFEQFYDYAVKLISQGDAYIDSLDEEQIREYRGSVNTPGTPSPYRDRSVDENLTIFHEMREGKYENGEHVLRAKIDMSSPHMIMRDPLLYRIKHAEHYRRGNEWCIYPMYDFAHPLEDAIENITHSLCTLEFDTNRALYDWILEHCLDEDELPTRPHQYEFARLNLTYTVMSKRKLLRLVQEGVVDGWDDPRLPTLAGLRRRGVTPEAIRTFCQGIGVTRTESVVEMSHFEHVLRDDLNHRSPRVNAVVEPLRVVVTNFPERETDWIEANYWPRDIDKHETREIPFSRCLYIDRDDFREDPPKDFYRLAPGREVRLRYGYFITCDEVIKDEDGQITELRCTYDPETKGGDAPDGRSPGGTLHWVSAGHAVPAEFRQYNRLFSAADPEGGEEDFTKFINPESLVITQGYIEPSVLEDPLEQRYQFERVGYFRRDPDHTSENQLTFNQIVPLRDTWTEQEEAARTADIEEKRREKERIKELQRERSREADRDPAEELSKNQVKRFQQYQSELKLDREDAAIIAREDDVAAFYEKVLEFCDNPELAANWVVNKLMAVLKEKSLEELPFSAEQYGQFISLIDEEVISGGGADEVFEVMVETGKDPGTIVDEKELRQIDNSEAIEPVIKEILENNPEQVEQYRAGKQALLGFFMGQVMKRTGGRANPEITKEMLLKKLSA